jgi:hypothetical protein
MKCKLGELVINAYLAGLDFKTKFGTGPIRNRKITRETFAAPTHGYIDAISAGDQSPGFVKQHTSIV